jgi:ribosomal protection tetracycline resistance protein
MLSLGILAHVDAGKTSLTERLLFAAGVIDEVGSVDAGSTQTDTLALERQRGITIKSAVASFGIGDVTVNLIDTPGHPDFIAEVERVLGVLDGAVLVISAVEGVQPQTRVLMRTLRRLRVPTLLFVNKVDRGGAGYEAVLRDIAGKLTPAIVAMGSVAQLGSRDASVTPFGAGDPAFAARLAEVLAEHDDTLLAAYVHDRAVPYGQISAALAAQAAQGLVHPVLFGSAMTGAGIGCLSRAISELLPAGEGDQAGPASGTVFKVERGPAGEKIAYIRMFSGTLRVRDRVRLGTGGTGGTGSAGKVTAISVFGRGAAVPGMAVTAGQIARVWGLAGIRVGDAVGTPGRTAGAHFAPPTLETVVVPRRAADSGRLHAALSQLAEQDPLINLRQDDVRRELLVSLYGEVQKEVIEATLAGDYGVGVTFGEVTTICIERPAGTGEAAERIGSQANPFLAGIGLRVEEAPAGSGLQFRLEIELGALPFSFLKAVEETVRDRLAQGLYGWQVTDLAVTMTYSGYYPRQSHAHGTFDKSMSSTAGDFRHLTPLVLMDALRRAGTIVHEPVQRFSLQLPAESLSQLLPVLSRLRAMPGAPVTSGGLCLVTGEIPAARVHELELMLPGLTGGEGVLDVTFGHYQPVRGPFPSRPRSDDNPLNRKEYLLHVQRLVPGR